MQLGRLPQVAGHLVGLGQGRPIALSLVCGAGARNAGVVSAQLGAPRLTAELAAQRNELVASRASLAQCCVIAHAAQGAGLASRE